MSGIAGILRRDGKEVPENWVNYLEQILIHDGNIPRRFEDSIPIQPGNLRIILFGSDLGTVPKIVDGDEFGECAMVSWNQKTLELKMDRRGSGRKPLYWLDLAEAGDGLVFCSNPLPLLRIARELNLQNKFLSQGVQEYLQLGYVPDGGALVLPVCSLPNECSEIDISLSISDVPCAISTTSAQDVVMLVRILGLPFADSSLLSTLWQYKEAKHCGHSVIDGVHIDKKKANDFDRAISRRIALNAIATHVGVDVTITSNGGQLEPVSFPLATWLRSIQSNLGQLLEKTIHAKGAFEGLPVDQKDVIALHDVHMKGEDHAKQLFALLTLELWHQQVLA